MTNIFRTLQNPFRPLIKVLCVLVIGLCSTSLLASNEVYNLWTGVTEEPELMGTTYTVVNAAQLAWLAEHNDAENGFMDMTIELAVNVDLSGSRVWTPIGSAAKPFNGTFDGRGHLVRGLTVLRGNDGVGLFGHIGTNGAVMDLGISGGRILASGKRRVGALAGVCEGAIQNCWSMAEIAVAGNVVGGLVGELAYSGSMTDVYCSGLVLQGADTLGALVGRNSGQIVRAYSSGYAKNGKGFVGFDKNGDYTDCFYDRKLYYQEPGVWGNQVTPLDSTALLFDALQGNKWVLSKGYYPQLNSFVGTDASILSVAPMFIDTESTDPVNHANDLTVDFTVTTTGGITWKCEDVNDTQWIKISGNKVTVVRPCTETDVLVDAQLRKETRVVYMRPRRLEDLRVEPFENGTVSSFCLNDDALLPSMPQVTGGTPDYHYRVVLDSLDTRSGKAVHAFVLADDDLSSVISYSAWKAVNRLKTDIAGHYYLRFFVHDEGCVRDWKECPNMYEYVVYGEVVRGVITSGKDTVSAPYTISINGTPTTGGKGTITYQWTINDREISGATGVNLVNYELSTAGTYEFKRFSSDEMCHSDAGREADEGRYSVVVIDPFDPGTVSDEGKQVYCTVREAENFIADATRASGGLTTAGYSYQWYRVVGNDTSEIPGATDYYLDFSGVAMQAGMTYTFVRKAKNNWWRTPDWSLSKGHQEIQILSALQPGAINSEDRGLQCIDESVKWFSVKIGEYSAASGEQTLHYRWTYELNGEQTVIGEDSPTLDYTLAMDDAQMGEVYMFRRFVRQGNCDWLNSNGVVTLSFGKQTHFERTITVCEGALPYTFVRYESDKKKQEHTFTKEGETWLFTDHAAGDCPVDTTFTLQVTTAPKVSMDSEARLCQENGNITLYFNLLSGQADRFRITYSKDLAKFIGRTDTVGEVTASGTIVLTGIPSIGEGDNYMVVELADSGNGTNVDDLCYSTSNSIRFYTSLGGYVHSKYDRVLFVDNNPTNGELPEPKLSFVSYQWYRNGVLQPDQTGQYYHENGTLLNGVYYVLLTDKEGVVYRSCDVTMPQSNTSASSPQQRVYPVPVNAGEMVTIECEEGARVSVVSTRGERVMNSTEVQGKTSFTAPTMTGVYFVQYEFEDGRVATDKLIVK